jgi:hypothetical protein
MDSTKHGRVNRIIAAHWPFAVFEQDDRRMTGNQDVVAKSEQGPGKIFAIHSTSKQN